MKTYTNIIYAVSAFSLLFFLSTGNVSALLGPSEYDGGHPAGMIDKTVSSDFNKGRTAGINMANENANSCYVRELEVKDKADDALATYLERNETEMTSDDFVAGFNTGFEEYQDRYNFAYCGR
ncbi:MAG: hypothetical protein A3J80_05000 [Desulfobacula sp. RIFOXYB2_FULL_45_6]|nr:MAG: hypothetical protein A3J80_05000 [Desulfobacula sp. RIFOXYB2_FULL_45_6]